MDSQKAIFLPEPSKKPGFGWACLIVLVSLGVLFVLMIGIWLWVYFPKDKYGCISWLPQFPLGEGEGKIAFVSTRDGNPEIYVINADGTGLKRVTNNPGGDYAPAWSPDGKQIAFHSERDGNGEIYIINVDGTGEKRLTVNPAGDYAPSWSPDGKQIAFHSHRHLGAARIFVMNTDGSDVTLLTDPNWDDWSPAWSPDGSMIVFNSSRYDNANVWIMNADGSDKKILTLDKAQDWWPDWSPDGARIAFHSDRKGNFDIYTMAVDGSSIFQVTDYRSGDFDPVWSPDGNRIAFTSDRCWNQDIWIVKEDGSGLINLTRSPGDDWSPAWISTNGKPITITEQKGAKTPLPQVQNTKQVNHLPEGWHDGVEGTVGAIECSVFGWAVDPDDRSRDIEVRIMSDGNQITKTTADLLRVDVGVCKGGTCGFNVNLWGLLSAGERHFISAQAYDVKSSTWYDLSGTPKILTCWGYPEGSYDGATGSVDKSKCGAFGWVVDPDDRARDLQVQVLVDGNLVATTIANDIRVDARKCVGGSCGFSVNLWGLITPNEKHQISIHVFDEETENWINLGEAPKNLICTE